MSGEVETPPASPLAKETPPAPIVFLPSDRSPWDWGWLFGSGTPVRTGMADPPAPTETNPPARAKSLFFWPLRRSAVVSWDRGQATRQGSRKPRAFHGFLLLLLLSMRMERLSFLGPTSPKASRFDCWR